jgi:type IV pilus biogenesis protein CpaD/CtpE
MEHQMSLINEYRTIEANILELEARREALKGDPKLQKEIEFESKLKDLLASYAKNLRDVINILDPQASASKVAKAVPGKQVQRAPRQIKVYKNPHTDEVVETKGGNHKILKEWKAEWGGDVVEGWVSVR